MNKSIYKEALRITEIKIDNKNMYVKDKKVYHATFDLEVIELINNALEQAQKQEQLLELYEQLVKDLGLVIEHDTTDTWDGPEDYEYLEINYDSIKSLNTYKRIKELEK